MNKQKISKSSSKGSIRIISGKHRGRKLPVLMAEGLRPTTDRVKETVFNWLMPYMHESICLDCFAGSGGLGFEAQSRGAKGVTLIELNKAAAQQLEQNKALLKANNITIENTNTLTFLEKCSKKFSIVFIDPPFRKGLIEQTIDLLNNNLLETNALIYIEMESEEEIQSIPGNWQLLKEKKAGQVAYRLYQTI
ncbi:16S rRNA (guanine(966)-N(2))-methyltransferase RsmD [Colwellia sp. RE-S-Sl-9]